MLKISFNAPVNEHVAIVYRILDKNEGFVKRVRIYHLNALRCDKSITPEDEEQKFAELVEKERLFTNISNTEPIVTPEFEDFKLDITSTVTAITLQSENRMILSMNPDFY